MNVKELRLLLECMPPDFEVAFLCPDGFLDSIEGVYDIEYDEKRVEFLNYCVREKRATSQMG
jgi:hypothetical protein